MRDDKMGETLGMKSMRLNNDGQYQMFQSETDQYQQFTPSILSPIKEGTGIGLADRDSSQYDPVRAVDENLREQQELYEKKA